MYQTMKHSISPHFSGGQASSPDEVKQTSRALSDEYIQVDPGGKNRKLPDHTNLNRLATPELTSSEENANRTEPKAILPTPIAQETQEWEFNPILIQKMLLQLTKDPLSDAQFFKLFVSKLDFNLQLTYFIYILQNLMEKLDIEHALIDLAIILTELCKVCCYDLLFYTIEAIISHQKSKMFILLI
jgi:hypothetical protein